jgi:hypothetical protein
LALQQLYAKKFFPTKDIANQRLVRISGARNPSVLRSISKRRHKKKTRPGANPDGPGDGFYVLVWFGACMKIEKRTRYA